MEKRIEWDPYDMIEANTVLDSIDDQPTIDAVEVVRCKDCKHRSNDVECPMCHAVWTWDEDYGSDYYVKDKTIDDGFCYCGEKEEE